MNTANAKLPKEIMASIILEAHNELYNIYDDFAIPPPVLFYKRIVLQWMIEKYVLVKPIIPQQADLPFLMEIPDHWGNTERFELLFDNSVLLFKIAYDNHWKLAELHLRRRLPNNAFQSAFITKRLNDLPKYVDYGAPVQLNTPMLKNLVLQYNDLFDEFEQQFYKEILRVMPLPPAMVPPPDDQ